MALRMRPRSGRRVPDAGETDAATAARNRGGMWGSTFASLSERPYAWYFAGNMAFLMATQMQMILRGFLAFDLTGTASALALVSVAVAAPMLLVAPFGGLVADRVNKRNLLIASQLVAAVTSAIVSLLILTGAIVVWHLVVSALVTGAIFAMAMPARQALVPQLIPQQKLMNAISLQMGGMNVTRIVGPALGGLLIAPMGIGWVYALTCGLFVVAIAAELHLPVHGMVARHERKSFRQDFLGGFTYIRHNDLLRLLIITALFMPIFGFPVQQILPVFADDVFDTGSTGLGILAASTGVGGLIGALIAANMDSRPHKGRIMFIGGAIMGLFFIGFGAMPLFIPALLLLAAGNVGSMLFMATNNTVIQASLPDEYRGRVMAVMMMSFGLMPLGVIPVTAVADAAGAPVAVMGASALMLVTLFIVFARSRRLRELRMEPLAEAQLSPVRAAELVAEGKISADEARRLTRPSGQPDRSA